MVATIGLDLERRAFLISDDGVVPAVRVGPGAGEKRLSAAEGIGVGVVSVCGSATSALDPTPSSRFQRHQDAALTDYCGDHARGS